MVFIIGGLKNIKIERGMGSAVDSPQMTTGHFKTNEIRSHPMIGTSACRCFGDDRGGVYQEKIVV